MSAPLSAPKKALPVPGGAAPTPPSKAAPKPPVKAAPPSPRAVAGVADAVVPATAKAAPPAAAVARAPPAGAEARPLPGSSSPRSLPSSPPAKAALPRPLPPKAAKSATPSSTAAAVAARRALPTASRLAGMRGRPPPAPPRSPPPDVAAPALVTPKAAGGSGIRRMPASGSRKRAPTIVPAAMLLQEAEEKRCRECGAAGVEDFCANCGASAAESKKKPQSSVELLSPPAVASLPALSAQSLDEMLAEAGAAAQQKKICMECYGFGFDAFCGDCGGKMLACDSDDEDDGAPLDEEEEDDVALKSVAKPAPVVVAAAAVAPAAAPVVVARPTAAAYSEASDPGNKEKVFCIDIGTEYTRFGYSTDAEPARIRSCVDGRANVPHAMLQIKGQIFPFDGSEGAFANNAYLTDLVRKVCKTCNYTGQVPLCITSTVQPNLDGVSDWIFSFAEGQVLDKCPPGLFMGYSPVLSLCAASKSSLPTGLVIEIGSSSCNVVPVYSGIKVDHCIVSSPFGGRMFQEFLQSRCPALAKCDEPTLAKVIRETCFASIDFRREMARIGFEVTAANAMQAWRGYKVKNAGLAEQGDGNGIGVVEAFAAVEVYFQPSLVSRFSFASVQDMARVAVTSLPCVEPGEFLSNVVVAGEAASFRGFPQRLQQELQACFPSVSVRVTAAPANSAWHGAKLLASKSVFPHMCTNETELETLALPYRFW